VIELNRRISGKKNTSIAALLHRQVNARQGCSLLDDRVCRDIRQ